MRPIAILAAILLPAALAAQAPARPSAASNAPRLLPAPREIVRHDGTALFRAQISITPSSERADIDAAEDFALAMRERGFTAALHGAPRGWHVTMLRNGSEQARRVLERHSLRFDAAMRDEGYILVTDTSGATVIAHTAAGAFYGLQTLKQLIVGAGPGARLHLATIRDWPAMRWRGVQDDLSRGPMPTLEYQKRQVRLLAAYKINTFTLYFEHTLQFASQPVIAPPGGSMSREDVAELVAYARRYHVTIIPQQQTFGHLHHALKLEIYADLAETPHGHVLAPGQPGTLAFTRGIFAEIDSMFPSPFVHLGADETFELGAGRTKPMVERDGLGAVYINYLRDIVETVRKPGKRYLFWGDIAMNSPELVSRLPKDLIAVGWDYWSRNNFDRLLKPFRDAGMETWVAPGISNWNGVYPNSNTALPNIQGFIRDGQRSGATGVINTTWDDWGDGIFEQNWYGLVFGAAASWQPGESNIAAFQNAYGLNFHGDTLGAIDAAQRHLMAAHAALQRSGAGDAGSYLFFLDPWSEEGVIETLRLRPHIAQVRVHAESALVQIARARTQRHLREPSAVDAMELGARRIDWLGMKFQIADEVAQGVHLLATLDTVTWKEFAEFTGINGKLQDMRDGWVLTRELFERSWRYENRPYWLQNNLARYDVETHRWVQRINDMDAARRRFTRERALPTPASLGVPSALAPSRPAPTGGGASRPRD
ncbi:MAG: beta-N-acetylhexosaminidase [Gemmatimonadaceae bacterium]|nr:beta-N-acetylhexosaminidase [Gemmatimonadaceae bacterium]MCW5827109.1 beta-N-acetylhexosaminidase [Gemmatimonadaceae bacterium]